MQTIDTYVSRPAVAGLSLQERMEDIRELCALSVAARARMLEAAEETQAREVVARPVRKGWLGRRFGVRIR
jgi:hypothetical protein